MTNFTLYDGTVLDHNQQWAIVLYTDTFVGTITALFPKTEKVILEFEVNIPASITTGTQRMVDGSTWDIMWSSFEAGYRVGTIYRYDAGKPSKRLPPHSFV